MRSNQARRFGLVLSSFAGGLFLVASSAQAVTFTSITACGKKLAVPGDYVLATNLNCTGVPLSGIEIAASGVRLHLAGHTLSSGDCKTVGITVDSGITGVVVDGGTVSGFNDGISFAAADSNVTGMIVTGACVFGIALSGSGNHVETSVVSHSGLDAIGLGRATNTQIRYNDISDNARVGVDISNFSNNNVVQYNIINRNGLVSGQGGVAIFNGAGNLVANNALNGNFNGIELESPGNTAQSNVVSGSVQTGIVAISSSSTVASNTVLGSSFVDLSDSSPTCSGNTWTGNTFLTAIAGSVVAPACIH